MHNMLEISEKDLSRVIEVASRRARQQADGPCSVRIPAMADPAGGGAASWFCRAPLNELKQPSAAPGQQCVDNDGERLLLDSCVD